MDLPPVITVAGLRSVIGFGYYSAAKHAVEAVTAALREEVAPLGIRVLAIEPGAFRTHAYAGFSDEPLTETVPAYRQMLEHVRSEMIDQDGKQPGDPLRGARAVIAAMAEESPPHRLVLGSGAYDAVTSALREAMTDITRSEAASRAADFPPG